MRKLGRIAIANPTPLVVPDLSDPEVRARIRKEAEKEARSELKRRVIRGVRKQPAYHDRSCLSSTVAHCICL